MQIAVPAVGRLRCNLLEGERWQRFWIRLFRPSKRAKTQYAMELLRRTFFTLESHQPYDSMIPERISMTRNAIRLRGKMLSTRSKDCLQGQHLCGSDISLLLLSQSLGRCNVDLHPNFRPRGYRSALNWGDGKRSGERISGRKDTALAARRAQGSLKARG